MLGNEILPQEQIGFAEVVVEDHAVSLTVTHFFEHLFERLLVPRLAIDDHTVHIENKGLE